MPILFQVCMVTHFNFFTKERELSEVTNVITHYKNCMKREKGVNK